MMGWLLLLATVLYFVVVAVRVEWNAFRLTRSLRNLPQAEPDSPFFRAVVLAAEAANIPIPPVHILSDDEEAAFAFSNLIGGGGIGVGHKVLVTWPASAQAWAGWHEVGHILRWDSLFEAAIHTAVLPLGVIGRALVAAYHRRAERDADRFATAGVGLAAAVEALRLFDREEGGRLLDLHPSPSHRLKYLLQKKWPPS
jgi:Zn-dependent protease with chaperone function